MFQKMLETLRSVEWANSVFDGYGYAHDCCPYCGAERRDGHADRCLVAIAISEAQLAEPVAWRYRFRNASGWGSWVVHHGPDKPVNVAFDAMEARPLYAGSLIIEEKLNPLPPGDHNAG